MSSILIYSVPVLTDLWLVSSGSKTSSIQRGDSSCSWVFICAGAYWESKELQTVMLGEGWWLVGSSWAPVPLQLHKLVSLLRHTGKNTNTQLQYSLYWLLLRLVKRNRWWTVTEQWVGSWPSCSKNPLSSSKNTQSQFLPSFCSGELKCSNSQLTFRAGNEASK